jgi:hypothetical protein
MRRYLLTWLFLLPGCIDHFQLDGDIPEPEPVIEGSVADQEGLSFVRISSSLSINGLRGGESGSFGTGALVSVVDQQGIRTFFPEKSAGLYRPETSFIGQLRNQYQLQVTMPNGREYQSTWEMMHPGVSVDSLFATFKQSILPNTEQVTGQHDFFITVTGNENQTVNFRTESRGIAQVAVFIEPPPPGCPSRCAEICYSFRTPIGRQIVLGNTLGTLGNSLTLQVATEPYDFHSRYFIRVTTYSLSPEGARFWNSIVAQQQIEGSIFDPQLNNIEGGNIIELETNKKILGYFGASATGTDSLLFDRAQSAGFVTPIPVTSSGCVQMWRNATLEVPDEFK